MIMAHNAGALQQSNGLRRCNLAPFIILILLPLLLSSYKNFPNIHFIFPLKNFILPVSIPGLFIKKFSQSQNVDFFSSKKEDDNFSFPHIMKRIPKLCLPCLQCYNNVCCHKNQIQQYEFISNTFLADLAGYHLLVRDFYWKLNLKHL